MYCSELWSQKTVIRAPYTMSPKRFRAQMMAYASFSIMAQPNHEPDSFWLANAMGRSIFPSCTWPRATATAEPLASVCITYGRPMSGKTNAGVDHSFFCRARNAFASSSLHSMTQSTRLFVKPVSGFAIRANCGMYSRQYHNAPNNRLSSRLS